jgi:hypothetical protein
MHVPVVRRVKRPAKKTDSLTGYGDRKTSRHHGHSAAEGPTRPLSAPPYHAQSEDQSQVADNPAARGFPGNFLLRMTFGALPAVDSSQVAVPEK